MTDNPKRTELEEQTLLNWQKALAGRRRNVSKPEHDRNIFRNAVEQKITGDFKACGVEQSLLDTVTFAWGTEKPYELYMQMQMDGPQFTLLKGHLTRLLVRQGGQSSCTVSFPDPGNGLLNMKIFSDNAVDMGKQLKLDPKFYASYLSTQNGKHNR